MGSFIEFLNNQEVISEDVKENEEFCTERKKGATKIAHDANAKGGYSKLTAWHFMAKLPEYVVCKEAIEKNKPKEFYRQKMQQYLRQATNAVNQKTFQEAMGKAEVYGEVYHKL